MLDKIKQLIINANKFGLPLPMAKDSVTNLPSVTLLAFYLGLCLSVGSLIAYHFEDSLLGATGMTLLFFVMTYVMYKLRQLDKFKLDIKNQSIEIEDVPEEQKEKT
mgnify:FL=1